MPFLKCIQSLIIAKKHFRMCTMHGILEFWWSLLLLSWNSLKTKISLTKSKASCIWNYYTIVSFPWSWYHSVQFENNICHMSDQKKVHHSTIKSGKSMLKTCLDPSLFTPTLPWRADVSELTCFFVHDAALPCDALRAEMSIDMLSKD